MVSPLLMLAMNGRGGRHIASVALCVSLMGASWAGALAQPRAISPPPTALRRITRQITPAVRHDQVIRNDRAQALLANVLRVDLKQPGWRLQAWLGGDVVAGTDPTKGREAVGPMALRRGAAAGLNGDFFPFTGDPLGLQITDGEIVSEPFPGRSAFGLTRDGRTLWGPVQFEGTTTFAGRTLKLDGINRPRSAAELILFTPRYGERTGTSGAGVEVVVEWVSGPLRPGIEVQGTVSEVRPDQGDTPIPAGGMVLSGAGPAADALRLLHTGDAVRLYVSLAGEDGQPWNQAWQAIGGGPRLVKGGQLRTGTAAEGFTPAFYNTRHPRTAVGVTREGVLLLVTVDGRQAHSKGMSLAELAEWLRGEGAVEAVNLDGGGSTTLCLRGVVVNCPSDGTERPVANGLLLYLEPPPVEVPEELAILPAGADAPPAEPVSVPSGTRVAFRAVRRLPDGTWQDLPPDSVTWGIEGRGGLLAQDGVFLGMRVGTGAVLFSTGTRTARLPITTVPGAAATVTATLEQAPDGTSAVRVRVVDLYENGVPGAEVRVAYPTADGEMALTETTDRKGEARVPLLGVAEGSNATARVTVGALAPVTVKLGRGTAAGSARRPAPTAGSRSAARGEAHP